MIPYGEPPDPGSGDGQDHPMTMRCRDCDWQQSSIATGIQFGHVFTAAIQHADETDHTLLYKGTPQDLSRFVTRARNDRAKQEQQADKPLKRGVA